MRWMFDANDATRMRPLRSGKSVRNASPTSRSEPVFPGRSAFVESPEQEVDAAVADLRQLPDVGLEAVHGRVVELPVARMNYPSRTGLDDECDRVRDGVRNADELDPERAELEWLVSRLGIDELSRLTEPVLIELRLHEPEREPCRDHLLDLDLPQQVREPAHVVLVPVREHDRAHALPLQVADVREEQVDAEVLVSREREPGVDDDDLAGRLVNGHVLPDLAETAERDDPEHVTHRATECTGRAKNVLPLNGGRLEQAEALQTVSNRSALVVRRLHQREPETTHLVPEEVERALDRDRVDRDSQEVDGWTQLLVERTGPGHVSRAIPPHHLLHLWPDDVRVHADAASPSELEERQDEVIVTRTGRRRDRRSGVPARDPDSPA